DLLTPPDPTGTAVVAHPHPLYGGTRHDLVVAALCRGLVDAGRRVLRFDFRGTGGSGGSHDGR
ncbi:MAG: alpha/beta hydrolase, partial [Actinobacteria bacterium]|nr:alpha/beta hydrolase [Actinomycetota bacterium]NIS34277.1 alpha/beta hydrolase [Actinomycetota bacterium]NIT97364.1 alpha/beta hydrolase [Actinomycetota bacterium]NIU21035.1 alpha/beta hydrolase [Actinomycetota bacterium]NIU69060.1 alpha/beta hydrolase [Actinomycetota bacterium]